MVIEAQKSLQTSELAFQETDDSINKIVESSKKIGGIVNVISNIAHQTNLLSLNAGIEAAKAGEFRKIVQPLTLITQLVEKSNKKMTQQNQRTKEMSRIYSQVNDISIDNASSMNQLFQTLQESTNTVHELSDLADNLSKQISGFQT